MILNRPKPIPTETYVKQTPGQVGAAAQAAGAQPAAKKGMDWRSILTVIGLVLFFVGGMAGVVISLRQRASNQSAPTAPQSRPKADVAQLANCGLTFFVAPVESPTPTPTPSVSPTPSPTPSVSPTPSPTPSVSPTPSPTPSVSPSPSPSVSYTCNTSCSTDSQCQSANAAYICSDSAGDRCRLYNNEGSATCTPPVNTYTCNSTCSSDSQCQTANSAYVCYSGSCRLGTNPNSTSCQSVTYVPPTPTVGCNSTCATNADCTNSSHICFSTSTGSRCRHQDYVNSDSCTPPAITTTYAPAQPGQPQLPAELPQTGAQDLGRMLWAGLGILGLGAVVLLML